MGDICAICLEEGCNFTFPGCGHPFHSTCALQMAQYNIHCPVCRQVPDGLTPRRSEPRIQIVDIHRQWRNYVSRRRRFINHHPELRTRERNLRELRIEQNNKIQTVQRLYDSKCRDIWQNDPEVREARRELSNMRRRTRRLERQIENEIDNNVGALTIHLQEIE